MQKSIAQVENLQWNPLLCVGISHQTQIKKRMQFVVVLWQNVKRIQGESTLARQKPSCSDSSWRHNVIYSTWNKNLLLKIIFSYGIPLIDVEIFPKPTKNPAQALGGNQKHTVTKKRAPRSTEPPSHQTTALFTSYSLRFFLKTDR